MTPTPVVSVIVLTYNQQDTVLRTLDSILEVCRRTPGCEIVISDDNSTDGTRQRIEHWIAGHSDGTAELRLLPRRPNRGVVTNYFETLAQCRGRYIADCSGDDYWQPWNMAQAVVMLEQDPALSLVYGGRREIDSNGKVLRIVPSHPARPQQLIQDLLAHTAPLPLHLSAVLYRKSVIDNILQNEPKSVYDTEYGCEDLPVMLALLSSGGAAPLHDTILNYTVGDDSVSRPAAPGRAARYIARTIRGTALLAQRYLRFPSREVDYYLARRMIELRSLAILYPGPETAMAYRETAMLLKHRGLMVGLLMTIRLNIPPGLIVLKKKLASLIQRH